MRLARQKAVDRVGQVASDLPHPRTVGILGDPGNLNPPRLEFHHDKNVHRNESTYRPDFRRREVH